VRERVEEVGGRDVEDRVQADRGHPRVLDLVRRRDHVGRVLRRSEDLAVAVEDAAALARDRHPGDLLVARLGPQRAAPHTLQPERAREGEGEDEDEEAEEQPEAAVYPSHRSGPPTGLRLLWSRSNPP